MLTPKERAAFAQIEQQLLFDDLVFAIRMGCIGRPRSWRPVAARGRQVAVHIALGLISAAAGLAVLIILGAVLLLGQPVPASPMARLSLLCLATGVGYGVLGLVSGPGRS